eukprot:scaffold843_cov330-Pavlova_lutheri.AAC.29
MVGAGGALVGVPFPSLGTAFVAVGLVLVVASVAMFRPSDPVSLASRTSCVLGRDVACAWVGFRAHGCAARCVLVRSFGVEGEAHSEARKRRRSRTPLSSSPPPLPLPQPLSPSLGRSVCLSPAPRAGGGGAPPGDPLRVRKEGGGKGGGKGRGKGGTREKDGTWTDEEGRSPNRWVAKGGDAMRPGGGTPCHNRRGECSPNGPVPSRNSSSGLGVTGAPGPGTQGERFPSHARRGERPSRHRIFAGGVCPFGPPVQHEARPRNPEVHNKRPRLRENHGCDPDPGDPVVLCATRIDEGFCRK